MKRLGAVVASLLLAFSFLAVATPKAYAAGAPITRMDLHATVAQDGTISVDETFDMSFSTPGHGPYLYFTTRQGSGQKDQYRVYTYRFLRVTSSTGAPTAYVTESPSYGTTALRIGSSSQTVSGTQTYTVSYTVKGIINPKVASSGLDELYWNVIGTGFTIPISNVTVSVTGPAAVQKTTCYMGASFDQACTANSASGDTATYSQTSLSVGQGLAVVAGWPVGTFVNAEPTYETHTGPSSPFTPLTSPWFLGALGVVVLGCIAGLVMLGRRGRDEMYAGLTPGNVPVAGEPAPVERVSSIPFAVQFTPPKDVRPGMVGTLFDEKAETRDVTATLVDLAVRGYWRIEQPNPKGDFRIVRLAPPQGLAPYELLLYEALFDDGAQVVTSSELEGKSFGQSVQAIQRELYNAVTEVGWFKGNPQTTRGLRTALGMVVIAVAFVIGAWLQVLVLAIPVALVGIAIAISSRWAPVRSALGSAVTSQALGFKQYLETAEADQIKWEEGEDIFSRYLPFAIAYGCADRWAKVFAELAARGVPMETPGWYVGPYGYGYAAAWGAGGFDSIISTLDGFSSSAAAAMTAATAGSSGGSGFSGGGFGGGGGGGGGGSW
ncbi:MAG TPA: DUF2207 domain-containing protein [Propionibacteriaceae bacterium]|nr:DUF2207 domain-containing protein [Propionibacteriaceae bacterium]